MNLRRIAFPLVAAAGIGIPSLPALAEEPALQPWSQNPKGWKSKISALAASS